MATSAPVKVLILPEAWAIFTIDRTNRNETLMDFANFKSKLINLGNESFKNDYHAFSKFWGIFFPLLGVLQIAFYFFLSEVIGYEESMLIRFMSASMLFSIFFMSSELTTWKLIYIEAVFCFGLPFAFMFHLVLNQANSYWFSSMVFCGLLHGILVTPAISLISSVLIPLITLHIMQSQGLSNLSSEQYQMATLAVVVSATLTIISVTFKLMIRNGYREIIELKVEQAKAKEMEKNFLELQKREKIISSFTRPSLLTELALGKDPLTFDSEISDYSVLFTDMHDFTTLSEEVGLKEVYETLNDYFLLVNNAVFENFGEVDKLIGDAVMAIFTNPVNCLHAYYQMRTQLSQVNRERYAHGLPMYKYGTGIAFGKMLSANFGSSKKLDRTVIGDPVNTCSRIESLSRRYGVDVLASEDFISQIPDYDCYRMIDSTEVKGKKEIIIVYELFGHNNPDVIDFKKSTKKDLEHIINLKIEGEYEYALDAIRVIIQRCPQHRLKDNEIMDPYLTYMHDHLEKLIQDKKRLAS